MSITTRRVHTALTVAAATAAIATFSACKTGQLGQPAAPAAPASADVVLSSSTSISGATTTHYVTCGTAGSPEYKVIVPAQGAYSYRHGQPCPPGPRRELVQETHPELYQRVKEAIQDAGGL